MLEKLSANQRGILSMVAAMMLFSISDTLLKITASALPAGQIIALRGIFASLFALGITAAFIKRQDWHTIFHPRVLLRGLVEASVAFLYILSLAFMPLATITAILQAAPLLVTFLCIVLKIEKVGWRRWMAIFMGFFGVLLIVKPGYEGLTWYALSAFAAAFGVAIRDLLTRTIPREIPALVITLTTTMIVCVAGFVLGMLENWQPVSTKELSLLGIAAFSVTFGNLCIIMAFRGTDIAVVSPFRYTIVLNAIILGILVFNEWPDKIAGLGMALIVASGLYALHREQQKAFKSVEIC